MARSTALRYAGGMDADAMAGPRDVVERRLTVVRDELQAGMLCDLLREHGIRCLHRRTALGGLDWGAANVGMAGAREVIVDAGDLEAARELLDESPSLPDPVPVEPGLPTPAAHGHDGGPRSRLLDRSFAVVVLLIFGVPLAIGLLWQLRAVLGAMG